MPRQELNIGQAANDGTGDTLREAGRKINANFTELYGTLPAQDVDNSGTAIDLDQPLTIFAGTSAITSTLADGSDVGKSKRLINIGADSCTVTPMTFRNGTTLHLKPNAQVELTWVGTDGWLLNEGRIYDDADDPGLFFVKE